MVGVVFPEDVVDCLGGDDDECVAYGLYLSDAVDGGDGACLCEAGGVLAFVEPVECVVVGLGIVGLLDDVVCGGYGRVVYEDYFAVFRQLQECGWPEEWFQVLVFGDDVD